MFNPGDRIGFFGLCGEFVRYHATHGCMMIKREDGLGGPAWEGTEYEGLWAVDKENCILIESVPVSLENKE